MTTIKSADGGIIMELSLVIPCFNEENNVVAFFNETQRVFADLPITYEYVFVNDGSSDKTAENLRLLFEQNESSNIKVINFSRNFGKEAAIYSGLENAEGELTCIIDADLQQRPEVVLEMLSVLQSDGDIDCVCAYQSKRRESKPVSFMKESFYRIINSFSDTEFIRDASDFRLFRSNVKQAVLSLTEYHRFSKGIFAWVGFNTKYIPYEAKERNDGETKWSLKKLFRYAFSGITSFTAAPLKAAAGFGTLSFIAGLVYALVEIIRIAAGASAASRLTLLIILLLIIGGIQLICLGTVGVYLGKVFSQVQNRPICIVKSVLKREKTEK